MDDKTADLLADVAGYYSAKLAEHGETPRGVDWNGSDSQILRFEQLARIISGTGGFSLNDLGCGYGALFEYLDARYADFHYLGCDVSEDMVRAASARCAANPRARFTVGSRPPEPADYTVASGIFNVRLGRGDGEWREHLEATLDLMDRASRRAFSFNCLTSYSDPGRMRDYLYYPDPGSIFDLCKRRYARDVALLHDYGLYEFTILVRKQP